jgi:hypothetical protein
LLKKYALILLIIFSLSVYLLFTFFNTESILVENTESILVENTESILVENTELQKLPKKIRLIKTIGELGNNSEQFNNPEGMDFFNEKLYVVDTNNNRLQIFSKNLDLLSILPLAINDVRGIAITNEKIFVVEMYSYIVKSFDHTGNFLNTFSTTWTTDLLADENFVYVIEPLISSIQIYDHNGNLIDTVEEIKNLHFLDSNDQYFVASGTHIAHNPHELLLIDKETRVIVQSFPTSPGTTHAAVITENSIFLLDDGILKIFDFNGNLLLEYLIEIPSSDSAFRQIEINENILYVLDTAGHNIRMLEIIYE